MMLNSRITKYTPNNFQGQRAEKEFYAILEELKNSEKTMKLALVHPDIMRCTPKQLLIKSLDAVQKLNKKLQQKAIQILGENPLESKKEKASDALKGQSLLDDNTLQDAGPKKSRSDLDRTVDGKKRSLAENSDPLDLEKSFDEKVASSKSNTEFDQGLARVESKYALINTIYKDMHEIRDKQSEFIHGINDKLDSVVKKLQ